MDVLDIRRALDSLAELPEVLDTFPRFFDTVLTIADNCGHATTSDHRDLVGWDPLDAASVRRALAADQNAVRLTDVEDDIVYVRHRAEEIRGSWHEASRETAGRWSALFLRSIFLGYGSSDSASVECWATQAVAPRSRRATLPNAMLFALTCEAESHNGVGWHIHPLDHNGRHLGYRLLFDPKKSQARLAWEAHGRKLKRPWGEPVRDVLDFSTGRGLYEASIAACRRRSPLRNQRFPAWASKFVKPGAGTFVAYDDNAGVPPKPQSW